MRCRCPSEQPLHALSFLRFTAFQSIQGEEDLPNLPPQAYLIPAKAIERGAGQVGEAQEAASDFGGRLEIVAMAIRGQGGG